LAAPPNDNFADRLPVIAPTMYATNCGATKEPGEPNHAGSPGGSSLWWSWTANNSGGVRIMSGPGVIMAVYTGSRVDQLTEVASGRDSILFYSRVGTPYAIALDTAAGECGNVTWSTYPEFAPRNDRFADRLPLTGMKASVTVANEVAGREPGEPYHAGTSASRSLWWSWMAPVTGRFVVSAEGYAFPARIAVYTGDQLESLSPVVAKASSAPQLPAQVTFNAVAGTVYAIAVDSVGERPTLLRFILSPAAPNDSFAAAEELDQTPFAISRSNFGATREDGEVRASVWFRWIAPETRGYALHVKMPAAFYFPDLPVPLARYAGLRFPILTVYQGNTLSDLAQIAVGDSGPDGTDSVLTFGASTGTTCYFTVDEALSMMSDFTLALDPGPANDNFMSAARLDVGQTIGFTTAGATREPGEPQHAGQPGGSSLWWKWVAPTNGTIGFNAWLDEGQAVAVVYTGNGLTDLQPIGFFSPNNLVHPIAFRATAGIPYWFAVDEVNGHPSSGTVRLSAAPSNDDFEHRQTLLTSRIAGGSTYGATHESGEPDHGNGTNSASIWWTWTAPSNGLYGVNDGRFAHIYTGDTLGSLKAVPTRNVALSPALPRLEFEAVKGTDYQIVVDIAPGTWFGLSLSVFPVPPNDHFANRIVLEGASNVVRVSAANASREFDEPSLNLPGSLWWSWTAPDFGAVSVLLDNAEVRVQVFTNRDPTLPAELTNLTGVYGPINPTRGFDFVALSNVTYYLAAGSIAATNPSVDFTLLFRASPPLIGEWSPAGLHFTTSPFNPWFRQTNTFFDAPDAAESGHAGGKVTSMLSASIIGPGALSFWWKVSTPGTNQSLYFYSSDWQTDKLSGPRDWSPH